MSDLKAILDHALNGDLPSAKDAAVLAETTESVRMLPVAAALRDRGFANIVTYSKKVFIPLTHLCRDVCHYCTFAQAP
ncbi:MAG: hypothetical protein VCB07_06960, partial [Gammaproteobacteria bacterium]